MTIPLEFSDSSNNLNIHGRKAVFWHKKKKKHREKELKEGNVFCLQGFPPLTFRCELL